MRAIAVVIAVWAAGAPDPAEQGFHAAEAKLAQGDVAAAVDAFVAVADGAPASTWADDALAEAARGAEQLGDLGRAAQLDRRIVQQYPDSRQARRAEARLAELVAMVGPHGEWADVAGAHERLLRAAAGHVLPLFELGALGGLVAAHPGYPRATAARLWIGDTWMRLGAIDEASRWYEDAAAHAVAPIDRWRATKAKADVLVARGDFGDAADAYEALRAGAGPAEAQALDEAERQLRARRTRWRVEQAAIAFLALALAGAIAAARRATGSWRGAARALARPPTEVLFAAPVAALLALLAFANDRLVGVAVAAIAAGGLAIAWLSGALLVTARAAGGRVSLPRALVHALAATVAAVAVVYLAVTRAGILDLLIETLRHGHE
jgi:tetratricopeptide (TPR) repeat protein